MESVTALFYRIRDFCLTSENEKSEDWICRHVNSGDFFRGFPLGPRRKWRINICGGALSISFWLHSAFPYDEKGKRKALRITLYLKAVAFFLFPRKTEMKEEWGLIESWKRTKRGGGGTIAVVVVGAIHQRIRHSQKNLQNFLFFFTPATFQHNAFLFYFLLLPTRDGRGRGKKPGFFLRSPLKASAFVPVLTAMISPPPDIWQEKAEMW